jgi:hypothetical protein
VLRDTGDAHHRGSRPWLPVNSHLVAASAELGREAVSADADHDGVPDHVEQRTGTHPHEADSDEDVVPDGVEDANHDGIVDADESDPRVPGLFPGSNPHIPEALMFDLVRGLGAKKDEVETNVLVVLQSDRAGRK